MEYSTHIFLDNYGGGKGETIYKHYGERFNEYFDNLDNETQVISQLKGCTWELAAILRLEQIGNQTSIVNFTKVKDEEATKTTVDESYNEGDSVISNLDTGFDIQFAILEDDEATTKTVEGKREKDDEEDNAEIVKARMRKMEQNSREATRKKSCRHLRILRRIKKGTITGIWINCDIHIRSWWIMTTAMRPYTCAANRYAKFGSNRRFKPGD